MPAYFDEKRKTWYCKFYYKDHTGQQKQKCKRGFAKKSDAQQFERNFLLNLSATADITFKQLRESFIKYKSSRVKASTLKTLKYTLDGQIGPFFDNKPIRDITTADVLHWQNELIKSSRKETTINKINSRLSAVFEYGVKYYGLSKNPCIETIGTQKRASESIDFWTLDEYKDFISHVAAVEYKMIFELLFYTGMRIGELLALTLSDIDFDKKIITINKTLPRCADETTTPKTLNSIRVISVPGDVMEHLKDYTGRIYDLTNTNRLFFMEYQTIMRYKNNVCNKYNIRQIRIHDFRHSHVSLLINLDCSIMVIADRIGDTPATVQSTYAHLYPEKRDVILEKLENLVSN